MRDLILPTTKIFQKQIVFGNLCSKLLKNIDILFIIAENNHKFVYTVFLLIGQFYLLENVIF